MGKVIFLGYTEEDMSKASIKAKSAYGGGGLAGGKENDRGSL